MICVVTETFLRPSVPDSFVTIDGYFLHRRDREVCRCRNKHCNKMHKGGGILVYIHSRFTSEIFDVSVKCESFWIKVSPSSNSEDGFISINASYHPPSNASDDLLDYLTVTSSRIRENYPRSVEFLCGDFNRADLGEVETDCDLFILDSPPTRENAHLDAYKPTGSH